MGAPSASARYGVALATTAAALALSLLLRAWVAPNVFLFFFVAVVVSAWYGGRGPALLAALAAAAIVARLFLSPTGAWSFAPADALRLAAFVGVSLLIGSMRESVDLLRRQAEERALLLEEQAAELEQQIEESQALAAELEAQAEETRVVSEELERADRRLRESMAAQLSEAQRIARLGSWEWWVEEDRVEWSDEMFRLYGLEPRSIPVALGSFLERVHPDDRERVRAEVQASVEEARPFEFDHRVVLPGGEVRVMRARGGVEPGPDGRPRRLFGTGQDVTAEREAEETRRRLAAERAGRAAAEQRARLAAIVESSDDAIIGKTLEGIVQSWNAGAERLYGWTEAEMVGRSISVLVPPERPDELPSLLERLSRGEHIASYETVRVRRDGSRVEVMLTLSPVLGPGGEIVAASTIARDITAHKRAEAELVRLHAAEAAARREAERAAERTARLLAVTAALSEARTPEEVAEVVIGEGFRSLGAAAGWIMQVSPEGMEMLGSRGYPEEVVARFSRIPLDVPVPLSDAVRTGEPVWLESEGERARLYPALSEGYAWLGMGAWASVPMMVEGRAIGGLGLSFAAPRAFGEEERAFMLAVARQSAQALERARLFQAERVARAEAEAANRAKFEFLTTMSHELRTPLNAIAGYVELLEMEIRGPVTPEQREDLGRIRRSQTHLLGLINDVLNFARVETGHVHFEIDDVPLEETLAGLEALIAPQVRARGLVYEHRPADGAVRARADLDKVRQIVLNLLSNAIKFTPSGGRVWVECAAADGHALVRVGDTGAGIPADKLETIFEPFVQVNTGYTRTSEGTGLGLAISRDLARAMNGDLGVESRPGEGSVFTLALPRGSA